MADELTIVIPVYNEGVNFPSLWAAISSQIPSPFKVFVVYDFDEDDTIPVVQELIAAGQARVRLVKNQVRPGVIGAILTGFSQAGKGPVLVIMADLSDDLTQVDQMLTLYRQGYDLVVASRYMKGGRTVGGPWFKQTLSRLAGLTLHWLRGIPTHDPTNAFKLYDREMLQALTLESRGGFELGLEITVKAFLAGYRITEIPAAWRTRAHGQSRFRLWAWMPSYLKWYLYAFRPRQEPSQVSRRKEGSGVFTA